MGTTQAKAHYFVTKMRTLADRELENTHLKSLEFPHNAYYALLHLKDGQQNRHLVYTKDGNDLQTLPE